MKSVNVFMAFYDQNMMLLDSEFTVYGGLVVEIFVYSMFGIGHQMNIYHSISFFASLLRPARFGHEIKPIFHCDAKLLALGTFASPNAKDSIFASPDAKIPTCWYLLR